MPIAGTKGSKTELTAERLEKLPFDVFERIALENPAQLGRLLDLNNLAISHLLEKLISVHPGLLKTLLASGAITPSELSVAERKFAGEETRSVATSWVAKDDAQASATYAAQTSAPVSTNSFVDTVYSGYQSAKATAVEALELGAAWVAEKWQNTVEGGKRFLQSGTDFVTKTVPDFFTKTIPNIASQGWNKVVSAKNTVVAAAKSFGHSAVRMATRVATSAYNNVVEPYLVKPVVAVANAVMSPVQTARNMYRAGREWVAGLTVSPRMATAVVAAVVGVVPAAAKEAPSAKPTIAAVATPQNRNVPSPRNGNFNALRAEQANTSPEAKAQNNPAPPTPAKSTPTGHSPNRVGLRLAGGPLPDAPSSSASNVAANAAPAPTASHPAPAARRSLFGSVKPGGV